MAVHVIGIKEPAPEAEFIALWHSRKHSRLITVDGNRYRWHVDVNDDYPWERIVSVFPAEDPNGARLAMTVVALTILPSLVRRLICTGIRLGYVPRDRATSLDIPADHLSEILHDYPRTIVHTGIGYTWTPESRGGLHIKIHRSDTLEGQLLGTLVTLDANDLTEAFVSRAIDVALVEGWRPTVVGLDCHWLTSATCGNITQDIRNQQKTAGHSDAPAVTVR